MSSKKTEKSKKGGKEGKAGKAHDEQSATQNEPVPELVLENPEDIRTIVINVNYFRNIVPLYPVSDIKVNLKYLDQEIGESQTLPVTDDEKLIINQSFEIPIDINSSKQLDLLASNPVFINTIQLSGTMDMSLYEQLQEAPKIEKPTEDVESLFSMYEAFNPEVASVELDSMKKKKKGKKEKQGKPGKKDKSQTRSKSVASKGSKTSKKSKSSKTSTKAESKSRTETPVIKSEIYGMCVIDLIPIFYGDTSFTETLLIQPIKKSCQILSTCKNFPELSVTVSIKENTKLLKIFNILNFTVESICNVPSLMITDMDCKVCILLPLQDNPVSPTIFYNPKVTNRAPGNRPPKRWPGIHDIGYDANTTKYVVDTNYHDITNRAKLNIEEGFADEATRLEFNYLKRNIMFKHSNGDFASHIFNHKKLVLEIYVTPRSKKGAKPYDGISDDTEEIRSKNKGSKTPPYLHLMAVLDVISLLYPGTTKLHIAAPVTTFTYEEAAKRGLQDSFFMPKPKADLGTGRPAKADTAKKKKGGEKKEKASKKDKSSATKEDKNLASQLPPKPEEPPPPEPSVQVYNEEGKPCFIIVEIELLNPFTPKRGIEDLKSELYYIQMQALQSSKTILNKNVADEMYNYTIREIVHDLNKNWIKFNELITSIPQPTCQDFLQYLQKEGAYQTYLNSITTASTLLITNKYKCEEKDFKNNKNYQNLTSEVFTDLISQMHGILNSLLYSGFKSIEDKYATPWDISFFYAKEAAELKQYQIADRYFMERIINDNTGNGKAWFDYAIYNIEINNTEKAFECVRESIGMNCTNKYALLLFAALLAEKDNMIDAEICLLNIMVLESKWVEGWGILYLFYQKWGRQDGIEMAMDVGRKLFDETIFTDDFVAFEDLAWSTENIPNTLFFRTAILLLKMRLYSWVELALSEEVLVPKYYGYVNYMLAIMSYYKKDFDHALEHIEEAKEYLGADFAILALSGHALLGKCRLEEARDEYFRIIESFNRPEDIHLVYLNCADVLTKLGDDQKARKLILITCKNHQTPHVWLTTGKLYFQENDLLSAEECFNEANMKDNRHSEVWGYLTLVNLKLQRVHEAEQCYQQAVKSKLDNEELQRSIIVEFNKAKGFLQ